MSDPDALVIGGGPAGAAAAVTLATSGLRVLLIDRRPKTRHLWDSVHPGIEPLLRTLGILGRFSQAGFSRYSGQWTKCDTDRRFSAFGKDSHGPWLGYHIWRPLFDALLVDRAREVGVKVRRDIEVERVIVEKGRLSGIDTTLGKVRARLLIDATGKWRWLERQLGLESLRASPRLVACYAVASGGAEYDRCPTFAADRNGWTWSAYVGPRLYFWVRFPWNGAPSQNWYQSPAELRHLRLLGRPRAEEVTWRITEPAGLGYFIAGDAAAAVDPGSSHGIVRAIMSGIMTGHLAAQTIRHRIGEATATRCYNDWISRLFNHDVTRLREMYARVSLSPTWTQKSQENVRLVIASEGCDSEATEVQNILV